MKKLIIPILFLLVQSCYAANWECVARVLTCHTWRMEVPTGWIVSGDVTTDKYGYAMTFVPDPQHSWKI